MKPDCCGRRVVARRAGWSVLSGLVLALAPKCPLCLAAYLSVFGVGAGVAAATAPWLRPVTTVVLALALIFTLAAWISHRRGSDLPT
jgi:membrane protein implicated in regulation of membrane protease activity